MKDTYALPKAMKEPEKDLLQYVTLIYGRPGIGKSTFAAEWPKCLMFSCERVSKGLRCHDFNHENGGVRSWEDLKAGVRLLEKSGNRFTTTAIDTADAAYLACMSYVCKREGISHPEDEGYGKGWEKVRREFQTVVQRLISLGGVVFTSHSREVSIRTASGATFTRIQPTLPGQALNVLKAVTDFVLYAEYARDLDGNTVRILLTEGTELVEAKQAVPMQSVLPFQRGAAFVTFKAAFEGKKIAVPQLLALNTASETVTKALRKATREGKQVKTRR
jgi:hypothetical protein